MNILKIASEQWILALEKTCRENSKVVEVAARIFRWCTDWLIGN